MLQYPVTFIYLLAYRLRHGKMSSFFCDGGLKLMNSDKKDYRYRKTKAFYCDEEENKRCN